MRCPTCCQPSGPAPRCPSIVARSVLPLPLAGPASTSMLGRPAWAGGLVRIQTLSLMSQPQLVEGQSRCCPQGQPAAGVLCLDLYSIAAGPLDEVVPERQVDDLLDVIGAAQVGAQAGGAGTADGVVQANNSVRSDSRRLPGCVDARVGDVVNIQVIEHDVMVPVGVGHARVYGGLDPVASQVLAVELEVLETPVCACSASRRCSGPSCP